MYKDMLLKMIYHKEQIIKAFIKKGYFPRNDEINAKVTAMDNRLAIFSKMVFMPGEKLDVRKLNHMLKEVYTDITFLYKVIEELSKVELIALQNYTETHLTYLEDLAKTFSDRASEEITSTTLGTTVFFQSTNFNVDTDDELTTIDLGEVELVQGKKVGCFANINNIEDANVKFHFNAEKEYDFEALPYNYNNTFYDIPGTRGVNNYELELNKDIIVSGEVNIPLEKVDLRNDYYILGGRNCMMVTSKVTGERTIYPFAYLDNAFVAGENCYITFFVCDTNEIEYSFNKKPLHTNFSLQNGIINMTKEINKVFLDVEEGFTCYFNLGEGKVYASSEVGLVNKDKIAYKGHTGLRDFMIKEFVNSNSTKYNVTVTMTTETEAEMIIDNIYLKEL